MSTEAIIGYMDRNGEGTATLISLDGYPTGVGQALLDNWDDMAKAKSLIEQGQLIAIVGNPERYPKRAYSGLGRIVRVEGTDRLVSVLYLDEAELDSRYDGLLWPSGVPRDRWPVRLDRAGGFFERDWQSAAQYLYLLTPDGWFGKPRPWHDRDVKPVHTLIEEYRLMSAMEAPLHGSSSDPRCTGTLCYCPESADDTLR